jgi:hypothetical protein
MPRLTKHEINLRAAVGALMQAHEVSLRYLHFRTEYVNEDTWRDYQNKNLPSCPYGWCMVEIGRGDLEETVRVQVPGALLRQLCPAAAMTWVVRDKQGEDTLALHTLGDDFLAQLRALVATKPKRGRPPQGGEK